MTNAPPPADHSTKPDPASVPVQLAATVIVIDDRPDLQVLCLRRRAGSNFVGGMTVFPGGGIDPDDTNPGWATRVRGRTPASATQRLDTPDSLAYWVAVARETLEETGVLLALDTHGQPCDPALGAQYRHDVDHGTRTLLDVCITEGVVLDGDAICDVGRWITPIGPPRRYDTRFFIARMPAGQRAEVDAVEAVHAEWRRPADALAEWANGGLVMLPPTVAWLRVLERFATSDEVMHAARAAVGPGVAPRVMGDDRGSFRVIFPGEDDYADTDSRDALAWIYERMLVPGEGMGNERH